MAKQARAYATREIIVQAAGTVFASKTYAQATLADILREGGTTQGSLYFHFDSKKAVALEVIQRQHQLFLDAGKVLLDEKIRGLPAMIMLSRELATQITTSPLVRAGLRLSTESADVFVETARGPYEDWIETCNALIERAVADGDIVSDHSTDRLAAYVIATFTGVQSLSQARTQWADILDRLEEMWALLLTGIGHAKEAHPGLDVRGLLRG
ncbi:ScbR family autoregulator-binding transcription factor [Cryobacterium sp. N21]|uniref:ScbR family autoregulator-binding transcription factor n=1 Tax=Cryobacterium sp. N21 TaxID=2048289 RepID=UPI000CE3A4C4|nr:ScbR family autoregulator-binding transcription factor [Cryobacterium sp. N21]